MPESARSSPAPPKNMSVEEELEYYRSQYESLEAELNEFQSSSRELEEALEKDLEISEKDQRKQKDRIEALEFEVEEWKVSQCWLLEMGQTRRLTMRRPNIDN